MLLWRVTKPGVEVTHASLPNAENKAENVAGRVCCASPEMSSEDNTGQGSSDYKSHTSVKQRCQTSNY